jgi:hypothetical protein
MAVDASGCTTLFGWGQFTDQVAWLTAGSHEPIAEVPEDIRGRMARLSPDGTRILYGSSFKIAAPSVGRWYEVDLLSEARTCVAVGDTSSVGLSFDTTPGAFQTQSTGQTGRDGFAVQIQFLHDGVEPIGSGGSSCLGPISANSTRRANAAAPDFALYASQAPPTTIGLLGIGAPARSPVALDGQSLWLDPHLPIGVVPVATQETGFAIRSLSIPTAATGQTVAAQFGFLATPNCGGDPPGAAWLLSEAIEITILP